MAQSKWVSVEMNGEIKHEVVFFKILSKAVAKIK